MSSDQKGQASDIEDILARIDALSNSVDALWEEVSRLKKQQEVDTDE